MTSYTTKTAKIEKVILVWQHIRIKSMCC